MIVGALDQQHFPIVFRGEGRERGASRLHFLQFGAADANEKRVKLIRRISKGN